MTTGGIVLVIGIMKRIALNTKNTIYYVPIRNWKVYFHDSEYSNTCKLNTLLNKVIEQDDVKIYGIKYVKPKTCKV